MAFGSKNLDKWNNEDVNTFSSTSDSYGFERVKSGVNFENHPFKIHLISSNAPVLQRDTFDDIPPKEEREFEMKFAINKGVIYDLSKYDDNLKNPLCVSRRKDGRYVAIQAGKKEFLSAGQLAGMAVPVTIGDSEMVNVTPKVNNGPEITVKVKTQGSYVNFLDYLDGGGSIFLEVRFRNVESANENRATTITGASILTREQIKKKYGESVQIFDNQIILPDDFEAKKEVRFIRIHNNQISQYVCINGPRNSYKNGLTNASLSDEAKKALSQSKNYYFAFQPRPDFFGYEVLRDNLFLRIGR